MLRLRRSARTHTFPHTPPPPSICHPPAEFLCTCGTPRYTCNLHPGKHPRQGNNSRSLEPDQASVGRYIRIGRGVTAKFERRVSVRDVRHARRITPVHRSLETGNLADDRRNYTAKSSCATAKSTSSLHFRPGHFHPQVPAGVAALSFRSIHRHGPNNDRRDGARD